MGKEPINQEIKNQIFKLRQEGHSISELHKILGISKSTVSRYVKNIVVLPEYINVYKSKRGGSKHRSEMALEQASLNAKNLLKGPDREMVLCATMLYWAEGSKKACEFINSDGRMVQMYLKFIRAVLKLPDDRIKATMRIFTGMDQKQCLDYWSQITAVPAKNFIIRYNDGGLRGKTRYGMCRITIRKGSNILKLLHCLILEIIENSDKMFFKLS